MATISNMDPHPMDLTRREKKVNGFCIHLFVFVIVTGGLIAMNFRHNPAHMWSYWVLFGWGLGVAFHAAKLFLPRSWNWK